MRTELDENDRAAGRYKRAREVRLTDHKKKREENGEWKKRSRGGCLPAASAGFAAPSGKGAEGFGIGC